MITLAIFDAGSPAPVLALNDSNQLCKLKVMKINGNLVLSISVVIQAPIVQNRREDFKLINRIRPA